MIAKAMERKRFAPIDEHYRLDLTQQKLINKRTRVVACPCLECAR
jgi:hypothetical protein